MEQKRTRKNEGNVKLPLRADRFFAVGHSWFFTTREGSNIGPFLTKEDAYNALVDFIDFIEKADPILLKQFIDNITESFYAQQPKAV